MSAWERVALSEVATSRYLPLTSFAFGLSYNQQPCGSSSAVERQLPKLDVAGSIPVSRSIFST